MPQSLLVCYSRMLPRLRALEDMRLMNVYAAASGTMDDKHRKKLIRSLERDQGLSPSSGPPTLADLAGMGVEVVTEEVTSG